MISLLFISEVFSNLTKINFKIDKKLMTNSINNILEKNISLCHDKSLEYLRFATKHSVTDVRKLFSNINKTCIKDHKENEIFISDELSVQKRIFKYNLLKKKKFVGILDLNFPFLMNIVLFSKKSLIIRKFAEMNTRVSESGLVIRWASELKVNRTDQNRLVLGISKKLLLIILPAIIVIGYSLAFVVLLLELWCNNFLQNHR